MHSETAAWKCEHVAPNVTRSGTARGRREMRCEGKISIAHFGHDTGRSVLKSHFFQCCFFFTCLTVGSMDDAPVPRDKVREFIGKWVLFFKPDMSLGVCLNILRTMVANLDIPPISELVRIPSGFVDPKKPLHQIMENAKTFRDMIAALHIKNITRDEAFMLGIKLAHHKPEQRLVILGNSTNKTNKPGPHAATTNGQNGASRPRPPAPTRRTNNNAGTSQQHIQMALQRYRNVNAPRPRPTLPLPRPAAPLPRPASPRPRPAMPLPRPNAPLHRPNAPLPRPAAPLPRPGTALENLKNALRGKEVKLLEGNAYIEWKKAGKYNTNLEFLGRGRTNNKGYCDAMRNEMKRFLKKKKGKARYVVLVKEDNVVVSAVICTLNTSGAEANRHVVVEVICTNKTHGEPLMTFVEENAKERGLRYVKLVSVLVSVPFYERLGYRRSSNACIDKKKPLTPKQIEKAEEDWVNLKKSCAGVITKSKNTYDKFLAIHSNRVYNNPKMPNEEAKAIATLQGLKYDCELDEADYKNRFGEERFVNGWRGKLRNGTYTFDKPVFFTSDPLEFTYKLPVFSKCV